MRSDAKANQALLALSKAIGAKFSESDWRAIGLITDTNELIRGHPRLLRSLRFGDDDYEGHIIEVLPRVLGAQSGAPISGRARDRFPNLVDVEDLVGLEQWLAKNERALHQVLYAGEDTAVFLDLDAAADKISVPDIDKHAERIRRGLRDDPAQAVGSAKELLETTLKAVLGLHGTGPETKLEIPALVKRANIALGLDAAGVIGRDPAAEHRRKFLGSLAHIVNSAADLRNDGFGTGHGASQGPVLDVATARLVVSAAVAVGTFYAEAHLATGHAAADDIGASLPF